MLKYLFALVILSLVSCGRAANDFPFIEEGKTYYTEIGSSPFRIKIVRKLSDGWIEGVLMTSDGRGNWHSYNQNAADKNWYINLNQLHYLQEVVSVSGT